MGILRRIRNIFRAKVNKGLDEIEDQIEMIDQKLLDMKQAYSKSKIAAAKVFGQAHKIENEINKTQSEIDNCEECIKKAVQQGNNSIAKEIIIKKANLEVSLKGFQMALVSSKQQVEITKASLEKLKVEIADMEQYRIQATSRVETAKAMQLVNEIKADVSSSTNSISKNDIDRKISEAEAQAQGLGDVADLERSADDDLRMLSNYVDVDAELAKYVNEVKQPCIEALSENLQIPSPTNKPIILTKGHDQL